MTLEILVDSSSKTESTIQTDYWRWNARTAAQNWYTGSYPKSIRFRIEVDTESGTVQLNQLGRGAPVKDRMALSATKLPAQGLTKLRLALLIKFTVTN